MTNLEMHIEFNRATQQVAANKTLKWLPEEVDWMLNKGLNRFIQSKIRPKLDEKGRPTNGFEVSQIDADAIRSLIVSSRDLVPYVDQDNRRYRCFLPNDYWFLLSDWSYTKLLCNGTKPTVATDTLYITALRQDQSILQTPKFYANIQVQLGGNLVSIPGDLPYLNSYKGYDAIEDISFIIPYIYLKGQWYWEKFDIYNYPGYYISVTNSPQISNTLVTVDGNTTQIIKTAKYTLNKHTDAGNYYDDRLTASDNISGLNSTEFLKSSYYSPISELGDGILYVYNNESFIVSNVGISYIRKPQPISLYLNTKCEIPETFHWNIVDLAVEEAKATLENPQGYQLRVSDNDRRVVL